MTDKDPTQPDSPSANAGSKGATKSAGTPSETTAPPPSGKKIDPWRFGAHTIPPDLSIELIGAKLPSIPEDELYKSPQPAKSSPLPPPTEADLDTTATSELRKRRARKLTLVTLAACILIGAIALIAVALRPGPQASETERPNAAQGREPKESPTVSEPPKTLTTPPKAAISSETGSGEPPAPPPVSSSGTSRPRHPTHGSPPVVAPVPPAPTPERTSPRKSNFEGLPPPPAE
jgi:hypothetical protein